MGLYVKDQFQTIAIQVLMEDQTFVELLAKFQSEIICLILGGKPVPSNSWWKTSEVIAAVHLLD